MRDGGADIVVDFPRRRWRHLAAVGLGAGVAAAAFVPLVAGGGPRDDVQVIANATTEGDQSSPVVATLPDGKTVVVWEGAGPGDDAGVFARVRDLQTGFGDEILVNRTTEGAQGQPAVAADGAGNFLVAWTGPSTAVDGQGRPMANRGSDVYTRLFDPAGAPLTGELVANLIVSGDQSEPAVTPIGTRRFAVAFAGSGLEIPSFSSPASPVVDDQGVFVVVTGDANIGVQMLANRSATTGSQRRPAVAAAGAQIGVVWEGAGPGDDHGVFATRLTGFQPTAPVRVNITTDGIQGDPVLATDGTRFLAAWSGKGQGDDEGVFFAPLDTPNPERRVNPVAAGRQGEPAITVSGGRVVAVAWEGEGAADATGIHVRRWDLEVSLDPASPPFGVNTTVDGDQRHPALAGTVGGDYTVAFAGPGTGSDVYVRRYAVNDPPTVADDGYIIKEGGTATGNVLANDSDIDDDSFTATKERDPVNGLLTFNADGNFTYTPRAGFNGLDRFSYRATDGTPSRRVAEVTIRVEAVNDFSPEAAEDGPYPGTEDETLLVADRDAGLLANDTDGDGDTLTAERRADGVSGTVTIEPDGTFAYVPDENFCGPDEFSYVAVDPAGVESPTTTARVNVTCVDDPAEARDDLFRTAEDIELSVPAPGVLRNDFVDRGSSAAARVQEAPRFGTLVAFGEDGSFRYQPRPDFNGTDSFTYVVTDAEPEEEQEGSPGTPGTPDAAELVEAAAGALPGSGEPSPPPAEPDPAQVATVTIEVGADEDAPIPGDDAYPTGEDLELVVPEDRGVLANDTDPDQGGRLVAELATPPSRGTLIVFNADGSFTYRPHREFGGIDLFTYQVTNQTGRTSTGSVRIIVGSLGDVVVATDDRYLVSEDTSLTVPAPGVLHNDVDTDGDLLALELVRRPAQGSLELNRDGSFIYAPAADFNGLDGFSYQITDPDGNEATADVVIIVSSAREAPVETTPTTLPGRTPDAAPPPPVDIRPQTPPAAPSRLTASPEPVIPITVPTTAPPPPTVAVLPADRRPGSRLPVVPLAAAGGGGLALAGLIAGLSARRRHRLGPIEDTAIG